MNPPAVSPGRSLGQWLGLVLGPLLALAVGLLLPAEYRDPAGNVVALTAAGRATVAMLVWMAVWWLSEAIELYATALLPVALFPLLGIASVKAAAAPYGSDLIFLFMGGFLLALAMQRWRLDQRIALLTLRLVGTRPVNMVGGFMLVTGVLSAFVSNTATAAMMLPIALSVVDLGSRDGEGAEAEGNFRICLMLGIAYAASIGGLATIVGTPSNGILVQFVRDQLAAPYNVDISFLRWLAFALPLTVVFLPITWLLLTRWIYPIELREVAGGQQLIATRYRTLGPVQAGEWATFLVFMAAALAWMARPLLARLVPGLSDAGIAILAGFLLFVIPVDRGRPVLDWETARQLPWGVLILFGGGLSLAAAIEANGVAELIGSQAAVLRGLPPILVVVAVVTAVVFLSEFTSNTATTATLLPVLSGVALGLGWSPLLLILPTTFAASCAFMMPVGTPPNAMAFATGHVTQRQMYRAGLWLNLIGIGLITALTYLVVVPFFDLAPR